MSSVAVPQPLERLAPAEVLDAVAHELRQPLSNIESIAYYLTLVLPRQDEKVQGQLNRIRQLVEQSNWILSSGQRLAGSFPPVPEPLDLDQLIAAAADVPAICPGLSHLRLSLAGDLPPVQLDPRHARALIDTLLMLFRPMAAGSEPVIVRTSALARGGASMEIQAPAGAAFGAGSALALESARSIVQAHGGTLESEADPATGIGVRVMLP